jgi:hypothetical protein
MVFCVCFLLVLSNNFQHSYYRCLTGDCFTGVRRNEGALLLSCYQKSQLGSFVIPWNSWIRRIIGSKRVRTRVLPVMPALIGTFSRSEKRWYSCGCHCRGIKCQGGKIYWYSEVFKPEVADSKFLWNRMFAVIIHCCIQNTVMNSLRLSCSSPSILCDKQVIVL